MSDAVDFNDIGRLPTPGDNVGIATRRIEAGTTIAYAGSDFELSHSVMEGHRFVLEPIAEGSELLSWGLPFGIASRDIQPGEYVCNPKILRVLRERNIDFELPTNANFNDYMQRYELNRESFTPGEQVPPHTAGATFEGYIRSGGRGVGTRNFIVVLATTSLTSGLARAVAELATGDVAQFPNVSGVVAVTHTEGGGEKTPNNLEFVLRTLAGFVVHPNVGGVLALDYGTEPFTNNTLHEFMRANDYPLDHVPHRFLTIADDYEATVEDAVAQIRDWLPAIGAQARASAPASALRLALQCGGSDAFSGITGNALAGWVAKELIKNGGAANLAETDELIGAEPYVLSNVRDYETAESFLNKIDVFKERVSYHGTSAEGNPSGGNNYRGLYNIALKSIGAARKKDPEVRLDYVIDYAAPMNEGGYYFMDSPGNDLESIAGQVASGSNLILFITGNGSITNFPFVPTLKFVTTTGRFELLANEMDVNAGRYNDGMPMDELGQETFELALDIASGTLSKGELAGHAQVSIWRDWPQTDASNLAALQAYEDPKGAPIPAVVGPASTMTFSAIATPRGFTTDQVGLVMPTSLCSGQVARLIAEHLTDHRDDDDPMRCYVSLVHTEGCGSNNTAGIFLQTMLGHLQHRFVRHAVMLEHGCEAVHNDAVRHFLSRTGVDVDNYGWASVQLDGGLVSVREKVSDLFATSANSTALPRETVGAREARVGLLATGSIDDGVALGFAAFARGIVGAGGCIVIPSNSPLLGNQTFHDALIAVERPEPSLAYGAPADYAGLHIMDAPTENPVETMTGLGATGVEIMVAHIGKFPLQAHPMVPLAQVSSDPTVVSRYGNDLDRTWGPAEGTETICADLESLVSGVFSGTYRPRLFSRGVTEFQLTRGRLGISL
ncbi:MAG: UxaA family hydrolase [Pseudomonadota bacterium]